MSAWLLGLLAVGGTQVASSAPPGPAGPPALRGLASAARDILGAGQGVYVEAADGEVLLAQAAERAVHPASVSKVPTTLALLHKLGPDYRFVTTFATDGRLERGMLDGDLIVQADGNPALVDEDALLVAERLQSLGIQRVAGTLRVQGTLTFDWQPDPQGEHLRRALSGATSEAAWASVRTVLLGAGEAASIAQLMPAIRFVGAQDVAGAAGLTTTSATGPIGGAAIAGAASARPAPALQPLVVDRSQPLLPLLKSLNDFSNNIFAPLAAAAGGASAVQALARSLVPEAMRAEIVLGDGAGEDPRNRLSPRAAVTLLRALDRQLAAEGHTLYDILPVAGVDDGTLRKRLNAPEQVGRVVGKTGTYGSYGASALVGAIRTSDRGTVYFAILDHGLPVSEARRRQDRFVRVLLEHLRTLPWNYQRDTRPAVARAEVQIIAAGRRS